MSGLRLLSKLVLMFLALTANIAVTAQTIEYLNTNNINAGMGTGGNLFTKADSGGLNPIWNMFEVPKGSGKSEIFTAALWMCAQDSAGTDYVAASRYFDYGVDYYNGPITSVYDRNYDTFFNRVFKVTKSQLSQFQNLSFPVTSSQVDSSILYWPGKGNPSVLSDYHVTISAPLAPFIDVNNNGIYEPLLGDYPFIAADQSIFFVFNDARGLHHESGGNSLGMEIRGMASSFANINTCVAAGGRNALDNTVFVQYQIENKSQSDYHNFNLGLFADPDIGCPDNDFVGCDSLRSLMFAYNATANDSACNNIPGYDSLPIALGIQWLNQTMDVFGMYTGQGSPTAAVPQPITTSQYCNQLSGLWLDGPPFTYGGTGYGDSTGTPTKFLYSGDPNDTTQWSEVQSHVIPSDQKMYGASGPVTFRSGEIKHYDFAFITSYDITSNHIAIIDTLKLAADYINSFYRNCILPEQALSVVQLNSNQPFISIYPNPATEQVSIVAGDYIKSLELMDIRGRILSTQAIGAKTFTLPVAGLARGVYLVNVQCTDGNVVKKIVVE